MEIFKDIEGYEGLYQISNYGRVKSLGNGGSNNSKERILKPKKEKNDYLRVCLSQKGKVKFYLIHRLVAETFIENPNNLPQVNHKDENPANNKVDNLEWCTHFYNINYSQSKQVLCLETGKIYPSTMEVERQLGFNNSHICRCCNGKYKTMYGFHWKYV